MANFPISGLRASPFLIRALGMVKLAAAEANQELGLITAEQGGAIGQAAQEVMEGRHDDQFVVDVFQAGAGVSLHMNANEVIANRANQLLGAELGSYTNVHPNDHVNYGQSTNDVFPTAMRLSALLALEEFYPVAAELEGSFHDLPLLAQVGVGHGCLLDAAPGPAGQLTSGGGGARHDRRDLVEGHGEHVVQHEREPFGRGQRVQHHEQGQADRVGEHRLVLGVGPACVRLVDSRQAHRLFPPRHARVQHVEGDPSHDRGQPAAQILHLVGTGTAEPEPGLLHGVVRLARRAEYSVGDGPQVGPVLLEPLGQPVVFVHRSHSSVAVSHIN
jgi:hypothetical protein